MTANEVLLECFKHFFHRDCSNAAIHTSEVQFSPITFRLAELLWEIPSNRVIESLACVMGHRKLYEEDKGR